MTTALVPQPKELQRPAERQPTPVEPAPLGSPQLATELARLKAAEQADRDRKLELARLREVARYD